VPQAGGPRYTAEMPHQFPVIDLFAGPGGLSEGFAASEQFRVALSIEKDPVAHQTLELRAFFRRESSVGL